jgi:hypothetical protein
MDISTAGNDPEKVPKWELAYSFREEYDLPDLKPETIVNWAESMQLDQEKCNKYIKNYNTNPAVETQKPSKENCMDKTCEVLNPTYEKQMKCAGKKQSPWIWGMNKLAGQWMYLDYDD